MGAPKPNEGLPLEVATQGDRSLLHTLWTSVASLVKRRDTKRILYTALERGDGATVVTACSAVGLVRNTRTSLALLEADLANPTLASYLDLPTAPGLSEVLDGKANLDSVVQKVAGCHGLDVVTAGTSRERIPGEFADGVAQRTIEKLRDDHECLFIDAPPILDHPETRLLLEYVDGVILVLRARSTPKKKLGEVQRLLNDLEVPILGSILNRYKPDLPFGLE